MAVMIVKMYEALKIMKELHACETVKCQGEECPICAMWRVLNG